MKHFIHSKTLVVNQSSAFAAHTGQVWWDSASNSFRVVTGPGQSHELGSGSINLELNPDIERVLQWASRKMQEEEQMDQLCKRYPNLEEARREFDALYAILREHR